MTMQWKKQGLIFKPSAGHEWSQTHAQVPTALPLDEGTLRIYYGTRDLQNRTRTSFIDVDPGRPSKVLSVHDRPVLELGSLGAFDDCGAMPSWVVRHNNTVYLYYIGWNAASTVRYRLAIGLALSEDGGTTFKKYSAGPIMDRSLVDPYFVSNPCVLVENGLWRMWYLSCTKWELIDGIPEPFYHIKYAESGDGIRWRGEGRVAVELGENEAGLARPCVIKRGKAYQMWYCYRQALGYRNDREAGYRMGFASSADGTDWLRHDAGAGIVASESGWDSEMIAYPFRYRHQGIEYLLYNGNGFGKSGFGYAVLER